MQQPRCGPGVTISNLLLAVTRIRLGKLGVEQLDRVLDLFVGDHPLGATGLAAFSLTFSVAPGIEMDFDGQRGHQTLSLNRPTLGRLR